MDISTAISWCITCFVSGISTGYAVGLSIGKKKAPDIQIRKDIKCSKFKPGESYRIQYDVTYKDKKAILNLCKELDVNNKCFLDGEKCHNIP